MTHAQDKTNVFNLGTDEYCMVNDSIGWITSHLGLTPTLQYTGGDRGWVGDNPFIFLNTARMRSLGWQPKLTIREVLFARSLGSRRTAGFWSGEPKLRRTAPIWNRGFVCLTTACLCPTQPTQRG